MKPTLLNLPDQFETERLLIRVPQPGEGAVRFAGVMESVAELRPWTFIAQREVTLEDSEARCRRDRADFLARNSFQFHIWRKADGEFVGNIFLMPFDWNIPSFEMGYWMRTGLTGNGYITEAVRGLADYGFTHLGAQRLELFCDPRNSRSAAVAERAGFTLEARMIRSWRGPLGELCDSLMYVQVASGDRDLRQRQVDRSGSRLLLLDIPQQLETERLFLRAPRPGDASMINNAVKESLDHLRPWMPWADHEPTLEETEDVTNHMAANFMRRESLTFRLLRRADERLIGACSLFQFDWDIPSGEIGYWVRGDMQGQGYVTEAVNRLSAFAFEALGLERIEIRCDARNSRSAAVAERAGYVLEARLRHHRRGTDGALADTLVYARLRGDAS